GHFSQIANNEIDMLAKVYGQLLGTLIDFIAIYGTGKRFIFQFLLHRFRLKIPNAVWTHQCARDHKSGQLITGVEGSRKQRVARDASVIRVTKDGPAYFFAVTVLLQDLRTLNRVI